jgi:nicotinamide mononucleotide transporter
MEWWNSFVVELLATSWYEAVAVIAGIASVYFSWKENILVYPTGILSVLIYVYITWQFGLFADAGVNFYYFLMSVYGWYHWTHTDDASEQIPITTNSRNENLLSLAIFSLSYVVLVFLLISFTNSNVPYWDSLTTSAAITAMWLMARKKIEHWIFWVLCNLTSIPLYIYKGLPFTSFQFVVFTVLAIAGWVAWRKKLSLLVSS